MKYIIKKLAVITMALIIIMPTMTANVSAESTVSITGGDQISGGEVFTVTVTFDGESIGRVIGDVTYDTEMLAYISGGSSTGNVGYVELKQAGTGEPLSFELAFQALKEGTTEIAVSTSEMYDLNEGYMDTPSSVKSITISGNADEEELVEETTLPDDTASDEGVSVDEKDDSEMSESVDLSQTEASDTNNTESSVVDEENSGLLAKAIMLGIGILVFILIIVMILRRKK